MQLALTRLDDSNQPGGRRGSRREHKIRISECARTISESAEMPPLNTQSLPIAEPIITVSHDQPGMVSKRN